MASKIKVDQLEGSTGSTITIPTGQTFTVTDGIPVASGGTGLASFTAGDILYATGATTLTKLNKGTAEQVLAMNSGATAPDWGSVDLTVLPTISVAKGGTNLASFTAGDILYATGTTTLAKLVKGSAADVLTMNAGATAPEWAASAGGGKILQVLQSVKSDTASWTPTATSGTDVMSLAITPSATTSKILLNYEINFGFGTSASQMFIHLDRGGTEIGQGDADGSRKRANTQSAFAASEGHMTETINGMFLDSPSTTSATTYKVQISNATTDGTMYQNRSGSDREYTNYDGRFISTLTLMEVGA